MTKLGEWLFGLSIFFSVYFLLITGQIKHSLIEAYMLQIKLLPIFLIFLLGVSLKSKVIFHRTRMLIILLGLCCGNRLIQNTDF